MPYGPLKPYIAVEIERPSPPQCQLAGPSVFSLPARVVFWVACLLFQFVSLAPSLLTAAPPAGWDVMRVYLEDDPDLILKLATDDYSPIKIELLDQLLAEEAQRRRAFSLEGSGISDASYVVVLEGDRLVSEKSAWVTNGIEESQPIQLGPTSLALGNARQLDTTQRQLVDFLSCDVAGNLYIPYQSETPVYWFGFTARGKTVGSTRTFALDLPAATRGQMLLALPAHLQPSSPDVVVELTPTPEQQLPDYWNDDTLPMSSGGAPLQWWTVYCSAVAKFELVIADAAVTNTYGLKHVVRSTRADYQLRSNLLELTTQFELEPNDDSTPLQLLVDQRLKIRNLTLDEQPVEWRIVPTPSTTDFLIELETDTASLPRRSLIVQALAEEDFLAPPQTSSDNLAAGEHEPSTASPTVLPQIQLSQAATINGTTTVQALDNLLVTRLDAADSIVESTNSPSDNTRPVWTARWLNTSPAITAHIAQQTRQWQVYGLTRFSIQAEWLSASCRLRITGKSPTVNELKMRVGDGWFVDSVRVVQASEANLRVELGDSVDTADALITADWDGTPQNVSFEIEAIAHSPRSQESEHFKLIADSIVTLPDAFQVDNYAVDALGPFEVRPTATLVPYQIQPSNLPDWQRELLSQAGNVWLFHAPQGAMPSIQMVASGGTFVSNVTTIVHATNQHWQTDVWIQCQPMSGAVDSIQLNFPPETDADLLEWHFISDDGNSSPSPITAVRQETLGNKDVSIELKLPQSMQEPFKLQAVLGTRPLSAQTLRVPIVNVPRAASSGSLLILPKQFAAPSNEQSIELLSTGLCCSDDDIVQAIESMSQQQAKNSIAARLDTSSSQWLEFEMVPQSTNSRLWAWQQFVEHTIRDDGSRLHEISWTMESIADSSCDICLPKDWRVDNVKVDEQIIEMAPSTSKTEQFKTLTIKLPAGQSTVTLRCTSKSDPLSWLENAALPIPQVSVPTLSSRARVMISPSHIPLTLLRQSQVTIRLIDRLKTSNLWHWLAPSQLQETRPSDAPFSSGWTSMPLLVEQPDVSSGPITPAIARVWIVHRTAFATMVLASVLLCTSLLRIVSKRHPLIGWYAIMLSAAFVVAVPSWLLPVAQILLLATLAAALLQLVAPVLNLCSQASNGVRSGSRLLRGTLPSLLILATLPIANVGAQGVTERTTTSSSNSEESPTIYGVLIPVDSKNEVAGSYIYAPTKLLQLLQNPSSSGTQGLPPQVLSAEYKMRIRHSLSGTYRAQEISLTLQLRFHHTNADFELPLAASPLRLVGSQVGGQELALGGRISQDAETNSVFYRPLAAGTIQLQLRFDDIEPTLIQDKLHVKFSIPPLPNATLRLLSDNQQNFDVESIGQVQKSMSSLFAKLGAIDEIDIAWPAENAASSFVGPTAAFTAATWIHSSGSQVIAACQLQLPEDESFPNEFRILCDAGWEPVGASWGDGELTGEALTSMGSQKSYSMRLRAETASNTSRVIRVLMLPKNANLSSSLKLPFLTLQGMTQPKRTLGWSSEPNARWRLEDIDFWQRAPDQQQVSWGGLSLSTLSPTLYIVSDGAIATSIRRLSEASEVIVNEVTRVHLAASNIRMNYRAQFKQARSTRVPIRLRLPKDMHPTRVVIDGNPATYTLGVERDSNILLVSAQQSAAAIEIVELDLTASAQTGSRHPLPRITMEEVEAESSSYRLMRAAGMECELFDDSNADIAWEPSKVRSAELLENLEALIGDAELGGDYRQAQLPIEYQLTKQTRDANPSSTLFLDRGPSGWNCRFEIRWEQLQSPLDIASFEIPLAIRDSLEIGKLTRRLIPTGDPSRLNLCVVPPNPVDGVVELQLQFPLQDSPAGQSISIPSIRVLNEGVNSTVVALPKQLDGQSVRWTRLGAPISDQQSTNLNNEDWNNYFCFNFSRNQTLAVWRSEGKSKKQAEILFQRVTLASETSGVISGYTQYWIAPNGQVNLTIALPEACRIIGIENGVQPATWQARKDGSVNVLLQPNYLPMNLRVLLQWEKQDTGALAIQLPTFPNAVQATDEISILDQLQESRLRLVPEHFTNGDGIASLGAELAATSGSGNPVGRLTPPTASLESGTDSEDNSPTEAELASPQIQLENAQRWAEVIVLATANVSRLSNTEMEAWLLSWHPSTVGISGELLLPELAPSSPAIRRDESQAPVTVEDFWTATCEFLGASDIASQGPPQSALPEFSAQNTIPISKLDGNEWLIARSDLTRIHSGQQIVVESQEDSVSATPRFVAAFLILAVAVLAGFLFRKFTPWYAELLSAHPYLYWCQLGLITGLLLPIYWPSMVLLSTAAVLFVAHFSDRRRRQQSASRG